jgi:hypothetical protein
LVAAIVGGLVVIALLVGIGIAVHRGQDASSPSQALTDTPPGHWPPGERTAFIKSCVDKCRAAPGVTPERYPVCDRACACAADEGEKIMTVEEMIAVYKSGKAEQNEKLKRITQAGIACAK